MLNSPKEAAGLKYLDFHLENLPTDGKYFPSKYLGEGHSAGVFCLNKLKDNQVELDFESYPKYVIKVKLKHKIVP